LHCNRYRIIASFCFLSEYAVLDVVAHIDIESFSTVDLKKCGAYRYAEDETTEVICLGYAFDDDPVHLWITMERDRITEEVENKIRRYVAKMTRGIVYLGLKCPTDLKNHARDGRQFRAHNSNFERIMLRGHAGKRIGFPKTKLSQWYCTAHKAAVHALPRDLERLAKAIKAPHLKDSNGKADMMRITKPRKPSKNNPATRWTIEDHPDKYLSMWKYNVDDVLCERACDEIIPDVTKKERRIFLLDQIINDRGWKVDLDRVADVQHLTAEYKKQLVKKCGKIAKYEDPETGDLLPIRPTQTQKFAEWVRAQGVELENLQAQTIKDALKQPQMPQNVRWALRIRQLHEMKAPAKYTAMERAVCADGALRGMFLIYGGSPGRWSSRIVQLQNLFRPIIKDPEVAIEAFRERDIDWIKTLYSKNPMEIFASCVRGMLIPRRGHDLIFADYAAIEARIVMWLADSKEMLKIFETHGLAYEYTAAKMFRLARDLESLKRQKKEHEMKRFLGKIAVLALGYQGGGAAFVKMAKQYGVEISFEQGEEYKLDWREANPEVADYETGLWANLNNAAIDAVLNPGVTTKTNKLQFRVVNDYLYMRLPSGRKIAYYKPWVEHGELRFMGIDTYTGQWCKQSTYGGKILQNASEGIARDLLTHAMLKLHKTKRYPLLGTIHDELVTEPREGEGDVDEVCEMMCDKEEWAAGLPVRAEGIKAKRYRK